MKSQNLTPFSKMGCSGVGGERGGGGGKNLPSVSIHLKI